MSYAPEPATGAASSLFKIVSTLRSTTGYANKYELTKTR